MNNVADYFLTWCALRGVNPQEYELRIQDGTSLPVIILYDKQNNHIYMCLNKYNLPRFITDWYNVFDKLWEKYKIQISRGPLMDYFIKQYELYK